MSTDAAQAPETTGGERDQSKEVARIAAFSDGVFAIAITLLALQLTVPATGDLGQHLRELWPSVLAFVISFLVIGSFWVNHHRLFAAVERYDRRLIWLNLLGLFFIVAMPFTTSLIAEHGDDALAVAVYALSIAAAGLSTTGLVAYALVGHRLSSAMVPTAVIRFSVVRSLVTPLVFLASLLLLPLGVAFVTYSWLAIPVIMQIVRWRLANPGEV